MNEIGKLIEETLNIDEIKSKCMIDYTESYNKRAQRTLCLAQIINYCILFRSNDGIVDYINTENKKDFLIKKIAFLLNIDNENIEAKFDEILKFTYFNFFVDGFIFHATNCFFLLLPFYIMTVPIIGTLITSELWHNQQIFFRKV